MLNEQEKRIAAFRAEQEAYQRSENIEDLNKRVLNLQFANTRLFQELQQTQNLNKVLMVRLSAYNELSLIEEYTPEDLRMLKDMGIAL